ncbi:MAG: hypothetical protein QNJ30_22240, partial [Kiloniellales bacterium]|nr:hypothetical protein [Kiloniellales bacterium]
ASVVVPKFVISRIAFAVLWAGSVARPMLAHRRAALTPPEDGKSDPSGGLAGPSDVVARLL